MRCLLCGWLSCSGTFGFGCHFISLLVLPGFLVYELAFFGCFLLLVTSHAVLIAAILWDGCLVLACLVLVVFHFLSGSTSFFGL
jgi:hypothetical protein